MSVPGFRVDFTPERLAELEGEVRAELSAALLAQTRSIRRELVLQVAMISSEEGAVIFGISPRMFRELCEEHGVPVEPLGYRTPRYRIANVAAALDSMAVAARADLEKARQNVVEIAAKIARELDQLAA